MGMVHLPVLWAHYHYKQKELNPTVDTLKNQAQYSSGYPHRLSGKLSERHLTN